MRWSHKVDQVGEAGPRIERRAMTNGQPNNPATQARTAGPFASVTGAPDPALGPASMSAGQTRDVEIEAVDPRHLDEAAARLMCDQHTDPYLAGDRFLQAAEMLGLSTKFVWGVLASAETGKRVRAPRYAQVLMAVPSSGGTAMLFLSPPAHPRGLWREEVTKKPRAAVIGGAGGSESAESAGDLALRQRVALLEHACAGHAMGVSLTLPAPAGPGVTLAQALVEPSAKEVLAAFSASGFMRLGDLAYMRRSLSHEVLSHMRPAVPMSSDGEVVIKTVIDARGLAQAVSSETNAARTNAVPANAVRAMTVKTLRARGYSARQIDTWLMQALDDSYIDTLDCPELCGLRTSRDVLESHRAVGQQDDRLWWLVFEGEVGGNLAGQPARGCVLLNATRESDAVELVYLGLGPRLRGRGLSRTLMELALRTVWEHRRTLGLAPELVDSGSHRSPMNLTGGVTCAVDTRNTPALALYERLGFVRFGVRVPMVRAMAPGMPA